jgi:phosphatidylserine decarboxylase
MADRAVGFPIAREGIPFVTGTAVPALGAAVLGWPALAAGCGAAALFCAWFFRNPRRAIPQAPGLVVAPGDGRILAIEEEEESRYLKSRSIRISIFLNVFDVHVNRIPCEGTVESVTYQPGQFLVASRPDATLRNEQNAVLIRTHDGRHVLCVQVAGLIARRIVSWITPGEQVDRGERFGLIRFGSRMDTFLPVGSRVCVKVGERVKGGSSILAELP